MDYTGLLRLGITVKSPPRLLVLLSVLPHGFAALLLWAPVAGTVILQMINIGNGKERMNNYQMIN
jgi:hypothetical protein